MKGYKNSKGFSLVELLVASVLGLILLAGVVQIFLSSKQSYGSIMGLSQVQDSGRLATHFISQSVRKAGYWGAVPDIRIYGSDTGVSITGYNGVFQEGQFVVGGNDDSSDANVVDGTDFVALRFVGDASNPLTNCAGTTVSVNQIAIERYYVRVPTGTETVSSLVCETAVLDFNQTSGVVTAPAGGATTVQPLLNGVENMQVLYGERNATGSQLQFNTANNVGDWNSVESVRFAMLVASAEEARTVSRTTGFSLLDATTVVPTDTRARRVFEQSIALRNPNIIGF